MRRLMPEVDWYVKIVLALIAVLLTGILVKPYLVTSPASALSAQEEVGRYQIASCADKIVTIDTAKGVFTVWSIASEPQGMDEGIDPWAGGDLRDWTAYTWD